MPPRGTWGDFLSVYSHLSPVDLMSPLIRILPFITPINIADCDLIGVRSATAFPRLVIMMPSGFTRSKIE
jgi:hypothetical protein